MDAAVNGASVDKRKQPRGRKGKDQQEAVIKPDELKDRIEHLVGLYRTVSTASDELNEGIKAAAEKAGLLATVVRKFVVARASDNFLERKVQAEQLVLCFDEIGAIKGA